MARQAYMFVPLKMFVDWDVAGKGRRLSSSDCWLCVCVHSAYIGLCHVVCILAGCSQIFRQCLVYLVRAFGNSQLSNCLIVLPMEILPNIMNRVWKAYYKLQIRLCNNWFISIGHQSAAVYVQLVMIDALSKCHITEKFSIPDSLYPFILW